MTTGPTTLPPAVLAEALGVGGLGDSFDLLPRAEQIRYARWVEEAPDEGEREDRIRALMRILHVWSKAR